jgi:hypothetical protein
VARSWLGSVRRRATPGWLSWRRSSTRRGEPFALEEPRCCPGTNGELPLPELPCVVALSGQSKRLLQTAAMQRALSARVFEVLCVALTSADLAAKTLFVPARKAALDASMTERLGVSFD